MRSRKAQILDRVHKIPEIRFEVEDPRPFRDQRLTSYAGLVVLQGLFSRLQLKSRIKDVFKHRKVSPVFGRHLALLILVVHFFLGFCRLRDLDYYRDDPMVLRLLGLKRLPDVSIPQGGTGRWPARMPKAFPIFADSRGRSCSSGFRCWVFAE